MSRSRFEHPDDRAMCSCCQQPVCMGETAGRGRVCAGCQAHYLELAVYGKEEEKLRRDEDHDAIESMVAACEDYFARHGVGDRPPLAEPVGHG